MAAKKGVAGMSPLGGVAALGGVVAAIALALYGSGVLSPAPEPRPGEIAPQASAPAPRTAAEAAPQVRSTPAPLPAPAAQAAPQPEQMSEQTSEQTSQPGSGDGSATPGPADQPATGTGPAAEDRAAAGQAQPAVTALTPPRFDIVRAAPDGVTVIAGKSVAGSLVTLLLDGVDQDTVTADTSGQFVAFLALPPADRARVLTLRASLGDQNVSSEDEIILAPVAAPTPAADPAPVETAAAPDPAEQAGSGASVSGQDARAQDVAATDAEAEAAPAAADDAAETSGDTAAAADAPVEPAAAGAGVSAPETAAPETAAPETAAAETAAPETAAPETAAAEPDEAPAAIAVLRADAQGVEVLQQAAPEPELARTQVVLDTIGYGADGAVLLSGRSAPDAAIRVYLDNRPVTGLAAGSDGRWRGRLGDVAPGVYTLRLDALDATGGVTSRLETPFKREAPEALAAAEAAATARSPALPVRQVTVQTGDTLWAISRERYGDGLLYVRVFEANRGAIRDPDLIYPGQVFTIPE